MSSFKNLLAYKKAFVLAVRIFTITKSFPSEEKYSLIDQIRKSSRSVCTNLAEADKRSRYKDYFISKLNDCIAENAETEVWLDFSLEFNFLSKAEHFELVERNTEIGKLLWYMINNPDKFL